MLGLKELILQSEIVDGISVSKSTHDYLTNHYPTNFCTFLKQTAKVAHQSTESLFIKLNHHRRNNSTLKLSLTSSEWWPHMSKRMI